jgi:outer membrane receptor for Fe3+-dicitrate
MATWKPNDAVTLLGGVRIEHTKTTVAGQVLVNGALDNERRSNDYLSILPSLHLTYRFADDTNLRAAVTRSFARPDFGDLAPGGAFSEADLALLDEAAALLDGPPRGYGHVIVDEAQDLTPMQLRARSPAARAEAR